jgi:urea transport system permease protein
LLVNYAKDRISTVLPSFWLYVLGALFIVAVTVAPKGLAGAAQTLARTWSRRRSERAA